MTIAQQQFNPGAYKETTRQQWDSAAGAWDAWGPALEEWLGPATEAMLDLAHVAEGSRVLDVAAGAGGQSVSAARRAGPRGRVLATDISAGILGYADRRFAAAGLGHAETRVMDGEEIAVAAGYYDAVISRVGLIYFPDRQRALAGMRRALRPGGRVAAVVYAAADVNGFFSVPVSIIRRAAGLGPPLPGQPGPFSLGAGRRAGQRTRRGGFQRYRGPRGRRPAAAAVGRRLPAVRARIIRRAAADAVRPVRAGARERLERGRRGAAAVRASGRIHRPVPPARRRGYPVRPGMAGMGRAIVAAVQAAPEFLDRDATVEKACALVAKAAGEGAALVAFPEAFVSGYPDWVWRVPAWHDGEFLRRLAASAVEVPSRPPSGSARRRPNRAAVAIGVNEVDGGTLYNTLLYFAPDGSLARHRKLMPTGGERAVWGMGDGSMLDVVRTPFGTVGGLICCGRTTCRWPGRRCTPGESTSTLPRPGTTVKRGWRPCSTSPRRGASTCWALRR